MKLDGVDIVVGAYGNATANRIQKQKGRKVVVRVAVKARGGPQSEGLRQDHDQAEVLQAQGDLEVGLTGQVGDPEADAGQAREREADRQGPEGVQGQGEARRNPYG